MPLGMQRNHQRRRIEKDEDDAYYLYTSERQVTRPRFVDHDKHHRDCESQRRRINHLLYGDDSCYYWQDESGSEAVSSVSLNKGDRFNGSDDEFTGESETVRTLVKKFEEPKRRFPHRSRNTATSTITSGSANESTQARQPYGLPGDSVTTSDLSSAQHLLLQEIIETKRLRQQHQLQTAQRRQQSRNYETLSRPQRYSQPRTLGKWDQYEVRRRQAQSHTNPYYRDGLPADYLTSRRYSIPANTGDEKKIRERSNVRTTEKPKSILNRLKMALGSGRREEAATREMSREHIRHPDPPSLVPRDSDRNQPHPHHDEVDLVSRQAVFDALDRSRDCENTRGTETWSLRKPKWGYSRRTREDTREVPRTRVGRPFHTISNYARGQNNIHQEQPERTSITTSEAPYRVDQVSSSFGSSKKKQNSADRTSSSFDSSKVRVSSSSYGSSKENSSLKQKRSYGYEESDDIRLEHSFSTLNEHEHEDEHDEHEIVFVNSDDENEQRDDPDVIHEILSEYHEEEREVASASSKSRQEPSLSFVEEDHDEEVEIVFDSPTSTSHYDSLNEDLDYAHSEIEKKSLQKDRETQSVGGEPPKDSEIRSSGTDSIKGTGSLSTGKGSVSSSTGKRSMSSSTGKRSLSSLASSAGKRSVSSPTSRRGVSNDDLYEERSAAEIETVLEEIHPARLGGRTSRGGGGSVCSTEGSMVVRVSLSEDGVHGSNEEGLNESFRQTNSSQSMVSTSSKRMIQNSQTMSTEKLRNGTPQSTQSTNATRPPDFSSGGDWSFLTELTHKSSDESSLDRERMERSLVSDRETTTGPGAVDSFLMKATEFFFPSTRSCFVPPPPRVTKKAEESPSLSRSRYNQIEIQSKCQQLSKLVYPRESSVVGQAKIPQSSSPAKIGILLERHGWRFVIRQIENDSPFFKTPLRVGQTLLSLNGIPVNFFDSVAELVQYIGSREWSIHHHQSQENDSVLSIVATKSVFAAVIKPTTDTLVGIGFGLNQEEGILRIRQIDPHGLLGLKESGLIPGSEILRLNDQSCPRTMSALHGILKSCVGPFTIVALPPPGDE